VPRATAFRELQVHFGGVLTVAAMTATTTTTAQDAITFPVETMCCDCQRNFTPARAGDTICGACWQLTELDISWATRGPR
jgi:predicted amidophosphoribosyltransferase